MNNRQITEFTRNVITTDSLNDVSLNQPLYLLFAKGSYSLSPSVLLSYHSFRILSPKSVNLVSCPGKMNFKKVKKKEHGYNSVFLLSIRVFIKPM